MKKMKFTFWLLGFGCGMALTGIIGTFCVLNVKMESQPENVSLAVTEKLDVVETTETPSESISKTSIMPSKTTLEYSENQRQEEKQTPSGRVEVTNQDEKAKETIDKEVGMEEVYKTITIPKAVGAKQICDLLEEEGLIDNADDFLTYIKSYKKQRFLKHGELTLPLNVDYERLLEELTV